MAKEVIDLIDETPCLYHDLETLEPDKIYKDYKIIRNPEDAREKLLADARFTLGVGNPQVRKKMFELFERIGGTATTVIAESAAIGGFHVSIGEGCTIMPGVVITANVNIGKGVLINVNSTISHDSEIGDFSDIACGVVIPGGCKIGAEVFIGSNATLLPEVSIGDRSVIGAGAVVLSDVPADVTVVGNPGKIIKHHDRS